MTAQNISPSVFCLRQKPPPSSEGGNLIRPLWTRADSPRRREMSPQATERGAELSAKLTEGEKSLAEFAPAGANKAPIIFPDDMCVGKNQPSMGREPCVGQPVFSELFALFSLAGVSPPASKRTKIPRKSKAVRCEAVLPEQKCSQTRKSPQRILCVFSRALTPYERISARQNRVCPCQSTQSSS